MLYKSPGRALQDLWGINTGPLWKTRGSQEPVIAHLVFNLTSKVDRK